MITSRPIVCFAALATIALSGTALYGGATVPEGWWKGQTHTHSIHSADGHHPIEEIRDWYRDAGYDFLVMTDHSQFTPFAHLSEPGFLCIDGDEISCCTSHTNGLGVSQHWPGANLENNVAAIYADGGVAHVSHPSSIYDVTLGHILDAGDQLKHMEIHNGIWVQFGLDKVLWDEVLSSGHMMHGVGADDMHMLDSQAGKAWIVVRAPELTRDAILDAFEAGDYYASTGIILDDYQADDVSMFVDSQNGEVIRFVGRGGILLEEVFASSATYTYEGHEGYVRAVIDGGTAIKGWTQPVFVGDYPKARYAERLLDIPPSAKLLQTLGRPFEGALRQDFREDLAGRLEPGLLLSLGLPDGLEIVDREGPDFYIEELDEEDGFDANDPYIVRVYEGVNPDGQWLELGQGVGDTFFDLAGVVESTLFIQIEALGPETVEIDGIDINLVDPFADLVVEATGVIGGHPRHALWGTSIGEYTRKKSSYQFPERTTVRQYTVDIAPPGAIILDLGAGEEAIDGAGDDITVSEIDGVNYRLEASEDGFSWFDLGTASGTAAFDLSGILATARWVRIAPLDEAMALDGVWVMNMVAGP